MRVVGFLMILIPLIVALALSLQREASMRWEDGLVALALLSVAFMGYTIMTYPTHRSWKRAILSALGVFVWALLAALIYVPLIRK